MLIGFNFEKIIGTFKLALFWILTVFGGNIFGALCASQYTVGSDPYVFGLFGGMIGITLVIICRPNPIPQASET
jgi:membrane associated rhomboid family serine protease